MFRLTLSSSARDRLVNGLRAKGISDERVLAAIGAVDRGLFVPENFHFMAHDDVSLPIARDQRVSQPFIVATMTAALGLTDRSHVLEIGTGSGYQTTVLSHLCRWVRTIERQPFLAAAAEQLFTRLDLRNVTVRVGDGLAGWPQAAPFEFILVTAAADDFPAQLLAQLSPAGGKMVIPIGRQGRAQTLFRVTRQADRFTYEELMPVRFVPLVPGVAAP